MSEIVIDASKSLKGRLPSFQQKLQIVTLRDCPSSSGQAWLGRQSAVFAERQVGSLLHLGQAEMSIHHQAKLQRVERDARQSAEIPKLSLAKSLSALRLLRATFTTQRSFLNDSFCRAWALYCSAPMTSGIPKFSIKCKAV